MVAPRPTNLDLDALRSFVTGIDLGSFARAAIRLDRSPSAISLQLRKLETQVGRPLTRKSGRGLALTEAGEALLGPARRLLALNDETLVALRGPALGGLVRLGLPQDFAETWLLDLLGRFAGQHPAVRVEVLVDTNMALLAALGAGRLDLALTWESPLEPGAPALARLDLPMAWIGPRGGFIRDGGAPLPLVAFAAPCLFRQHLSEPDRALGGGGGRPRHRPAGAPRIAAEPVGPGGGLREPAGFATHRVGAAAYGRAPLGGPRPPRRPPAGGDGPGPVRLTAAGHSAAKSPGISEPCPTSCGDPAEALPSAGAFGSPGAVSQFRVGRATMRLPR